MLQFTMRKPQVQRLLQKVNFNKTSSYILVTCCFLCIINFIFLIVANFDVMALLWFWYGIPVITGVWIIPTVFLIGFNIYIIRNFNNKPNNLILQSIKHYWGVLWGILLGLFISVLIGSNLTPIQNKTLDLDLLKQHLLLAILTILPILIYLILTIVSNLATYLITKK